MKRVAGLNRVVTCTLVPPLFLWVVTSFREGYGGVTEMYSCKRDVLDLAGFASYSDSKGR
jgi:hypothetical protein